MPSVGFSGAWGNQAMADAQRQRLMDLLSQKQQEFNNSIALRGADRADRSLSQQDELTRLKIQEMADAKKATEADSQFKIGTTLNNTIPAGSILPPESPAVGPLQMLGALKEQAPTLPSTSYIGTQTTAPQPENPNTTIQGTLRMAQNAGNPRQFVKLPSQAEGVAANAASDRQAMNEARIQSLQSAAENAVTRANAAGATAEARSQAAAATLALQQAKFEAAQTAADTKSSAWMPTGAISLDATGHPSFVFRNLKGEVKYVAAPPGMKIEKPAQGGGIGDWWRSMFGTEPTATDPTDPNWGK